MPPSRRRSRGHIEQLPSGSWRAVVYGGIDPLTGKRRLLRETAGTRVAAEVAMTKLQNQFDERRHAPSTINVAELVEKWLDVAELEATTRHRYQGLIRLYIEPTFGSKQASKLTAEVLERFYARLRRCNKMCSGSQRGHTCRPLSASTVRQIHFILRAAMDRAVHWRYLTVNEAALAEPPSFERPDPDPPTAAEIGAVLNDAWREPVWGMFVWLAMATGCRRGEMCALRWTDVDLDRAVLTVERSYAQTAQGLVEKATKTGQKRRLALDAHTVSLLTAYREQCDAETASLGLRPTRDTFVFSPAPDSSEPLLPSTVTQKYRRLATRVGIRSTRLHALRHYSATEMLAAGVDLRTVAGRLGHGSGGGTTLRFYAAWVGEADKRAAETLASVIPRPDPTQRQPQNPYEFIAEALRREIDAGRLSPGDPIPTTKQLAEQHRVSVGTASRAIALLKEAGLAVTASRGTRAVVTPPNEINPLLTSTNKAG